MSRFRIPLVILAGFFVAVGSALVVYRPDRPIETIVPGSSSGPAFVVQIIRPRMGLPLGGILPPQWFGLDRHLGFDHRSAGATFGRVGSRRLEIRADTWDLVVLDDDGQVAAGTRVVFEMIFEEQLQRVRCRPADRAVGAFSRSVVSGSGELSGSFDIELAHCEHADTGTPLGWPAQPLLLHGSFDRLPPGQRDTAVPAHRLSSCGAHRPCAASFALSASPAAE